MLKPKVSFHEVTLRNSRSELFTRILRSDDRSRRETPALRDIGIYTLHDVLDGFLDVARPEAYVIASRWKVDYYLFEFENNISLELLECRRNFCAVKEYLSQVSRSDVGELAASNAILKMVIDIYPKILHDLKMSKADKNTLERIEKVEPRLVRTIPTRKIGAPEGQSKLAIGVEDRVPLSLLKIYESASGWKIAKDRSQGSGEMRSEVSIRTSSLM